MRKVYFKNLGCPKNEVDGRVLLRLLQDRRLQPVTDPREADIIVLNTCGFIDAAKEESLHEAFRLAALKRGRTAKLVLAGCLAQRYKHSLQAEMPEVDLVVGIGNLAAARDSIIELIDHDGEPERLPMRYREYGRFGQTEGLPYAYLKISDGCDNFCSYCAIPMIRGRFRSRSMAAVMREAEYLVGQGVRELILVGQDTTDYGRDLYGARRLVALLRKLESIPGLSWIRLLYTHPAHYDEQLIDYLAASEKVVPYLDLPLQHISGSVLRRMNRRVTAGGIRRLVARLRERIPGLVLRTSYIIGFPGETRRDFRALVEFQAEYAIERVGMFAYSREEGTRAAGLGPRVRSGTVAERVDELMILAQEQSERRNRALIGRRLEVIVDEKRPGGYFTGRTYDQAPQIDGCVRFKGAASVGQFCEVRVIGSEAYDLIGAGGKE